MGASVSPLPDRLAVEPGAAAAVTVRVRNRGRVVDEFHFDVLGEPGEWARIEPPTLSLFPGTESTTTLHMEPPELPTLPPGRVPYALRVASQKYPDDTVVTEGELLLGTFRRWKAEISPRTSRGRRSGRYELAFDNYGNAPTTALVSATDNENALVFRVTPPELLARPGRAEIAKVRVRPRRRLWRGPDRMFPFQLHVRAESGDPQALDGLFVQTASLPRISLPFALLLAALVVAWAVVRPDAESTAPESTAAKTEQRTAQAVVSAQRAASSAEKASAAAGKASAAAGKASAAAGKASVAAAKAGNQATAAATAAGGANATAQVAGSKANGAAATAQTAAADADKATRIATGAFRGTPAGYRLELACPPRCSAAVRAPAGKVLSISDVVLENSYDDRGTLTLLLQGEPLLVEPLSDLRTQSFSFVTPIVAGAGQLLGLRVSCANAANHPCRPAAYLSGFTGSKPAVAAPGKPESVRLALRCPPRCSARAAGGKGKALALTDVVFGNPGGDRGIVRLLRGRNELLTARLDGMRDVPYHFAAPIVAAEPLVLTVACSNPKGKPCTAAAYLGGLRVKAAK